MPRVAALGLSAAIYTLPAHQVCVYMGSLAYVLADLAAFAGFLVINPAQAPFKSVRPWNYLIGGTRLVLGIALLLLAFLTYPPRALFFSVALGTLVMVRRPASCQGLLRTLAFNLGVLAAAALGYYLLVRLIFCPPERQAQLPPGYRGSGSRGPLQKV